MPPKEPPGGLELKVTQTQRTVEAMTNHIDQMDTRLDRLAGSVEVLTDQVGRMAEGLTKLENLLTNGFQDLKRQSEKRDEQIDRLLSLLERLIPQKP